MMSGTFFIFYAGYLSALTMPAFISPVPACVRLLSVCVCVCVCVCLSRLWSPEKRFEVETSFFFNTRIDPEHNP